MNAPSPAQAASPAPEATVGRAAMLRLRLASALPSMLAPLVAVALAAVVCGVILALSGHNPFSAYAEMISFGTTEGSLLVAANKAVPLYLSAMASSATSARACCATAGCWPRKASWSWS